MSNIKEVNIDFDIFKQIIRDFLSVLKNEEKILNYKLFQKPLNKKMILVSFQYLFLKIIIKSKNFWLNLTNKALNETKEKKRLLFVFCIGLFNFIATTPFSLIIILPMTFGTLLFILDKQNSNGVSIKKQILTIWAFLFGHFVSVFWWLFVPLITDFLHLFWITPFAILGLPFLFTLCIIIFVILFFYFSIFLEKRKVYQKIVNILQLSESDIFDLKIFIILLLSWMCGEFIRGHIIFGGFPWMMFGHFMTYSFAFQTVKFLGIDLYSVFFLSLVLSLYFLVFRKNNLVISKISRGICYSWIVNCILGLFIIIITPNIKIDANIVASQANIPASLHEENYRENLNKNLKLISWVSLSKKPTIMLMPESSIYQSLDSGDYLVTNIGKIIPNEQSILLSGGFWIDKNEKKIYNVNYAINNDGHIIDLYKKQKLVPFGEYLPFRSILPEGLVNITGMTMDFSIDGENDLFVFYQNLPIIYQTSCYESIFPNYVKQNIKVSKQKLEEVEKEYKNNVNIKSIQKRGELIVNLTNDAWMKWSVGAYQHFLMARFLAVSTGLPVVRVSNNGISAYIEQTGIIKQKTSLNKEGILYIQNI